MPSPRTTEEVTELDCEPLIGGVPEDFTPIRGDFLERYGYKLNMEQGAIMV